MDAELTKKLDYRDGIQDAADFILKRLRERHQEAVRGLRHGHARGLSEAIDVVIQYLGGVPSE